MFFFSPAAVNSGDSLRCVESEIVDDANYCTEEEFCPAKLSRQDVVVRRQNAVVVIPPTRRWDWLCISMFVGVFRCDIVDVRVERFSVEGFLLLLDSPIERSSVR